MKSAEYRVHVFAHTKIFNDTILIEAARDKIANDPSTPAIRGAPENYLFSIDLEFLVTRNAGTRVPT